MHPCKQVEPVFDMVEVASCFPDWKAVVKTFGPALYALHRPSFDNASLRGMYMVIQVQEPTCLRIPGVPINGNWTLSITVYRGGNKPPYTTIIIALSNASLIQSILFVLTAVAASMNAGVMMGRTNPWYNRFRNLLEGEKRRMRTTLVWCSCHAVWFCYSSVNTLVMFNVKYL